MPVRSVGAGLGCRVVTNGVMVGKGVRVMVAVRLGTGGVAVAGAAVALGSAMTVCGGVSDGWGGRSRIVVALHALRNRTIRKGRNLRNMSFFSTPLTLPGYESQNVSKYERSQAPS